MKLLLRKPSIYQILLISILLLGFSRGMMYANLMPPWGIIDEEQHLDYIKRVAENQGVPVVGKTYLSPEILDSLFEVHRWDTFHLRTPDSQTPEDMWIEIYSYEGYHPPVYYFLLAYIYALLPGSVLLKLFLLRGVTVGLSLITVLIAVRWTKDLFPSYALLPYLVSLTLVLIPERTMATSRVNNDALLEVFGAAFMWLSTRAIIDGWSPSRSRWMAIVLGLGVLTKISMAALGLILLLVFWSNRRRPDLVRSCLWTASILMVLVLPFVIYNLTVYGDLTGTAGFKHLLEMTSQIPTPALTIAGLFRAISQIFTHFWVIWWKGPGVGTNLILNILYIALFVLSTASVVGVIYSTRSKHKDYDGWPKKLTVTYLVLIAFFVLNVLVSYFNAGDRSVVPVPVIQGRFFLPVIIPMVMLFTTGLYFVPRIRWHLIISACIVLVLADSLNLFGNLLRQFYYWTWLYQNGESISLAQPSLQEGIVLFFTRFWMDKPDAIKPVIYLVIPLYFVALIGVVATFFHTYRLETQQDDQLHPLEINKSSKTLNIQKFVRDTLLWVGVPFVITFMVTVALRPPGIFWSLDEGGKYIYLENVLNFGNLAAPLDYPGRAIDPKAEFIPLYYNIRVSDKEIYSWWPIGFPLLTIPFYLIFGWLGVYVLPAASGAAASVFSGLITRRLLPERKGLDLVAAVLVGITTPVFYYSTMFWEHTPSTAFFLGSIYCLVVAYQEHSTSPYLWMLSGALVSVSAFFRTDALPLAFGIGLVVLFTRFRWVVAYGMGFVITSLPWLAFNKLVMGDYLSRQMASIDAQGWFVGFRAVGIKFIPYALFNAPLVQALPIGRNLLILGTLCFTVAVVAPFFKRFHWAALMAYTGLLVISAWALFNPWGYRSVHGFLLIAPHVIFCVWFWVNGSYKKFSFVQLAFLSGLAVYIAVYLAKVWVAGGGQQWGPRYQLALYPLLIIASLAGIAYNWHVFHKTIRVGILVLFVLQAVVGAGFEIRGVYWAQKAAEYYDVTRTAIYALPDKPITTNCTFLPMLIPEFYEKGNIFNRGSSKLKAWSIEAAAQGVTEFYDIDVDVCSYNRLDEVVENRKQNPDGMIIKKYNVRDFLE